MRNKLIWGLGVLVILLVGATVFVYFKNRAEIARSEQSARDAEALLAAPDKQKPREIDVAPDDYKPPPLGETDDTGYWEGNTWHVKPAPKPKKRGFWSEDPDKLADRIIYSGPDGIRGPERFLLAQRIIREYPYSEAALKMRYLLKRYDGNGNRRGLGIGTEAEVAYIKDMLKYHPNSTRVLSDLALKLCIDSPEEAIAFGQKSLRIDPSNIESNIASHNALGAAYQRLGDYKTALFHLKAGQKLSDPDEFSYVAIRIDEDTVIGNNYDRFTYEISMIEAGTPRYGPDPQPPVSSSVDVPLFPSETVSPPPAPAPLFDPFSVFPSDMSGSRSVNDRGVDPSVLSSWRDDPAFGDRASFVERREREAEEFEGFRQWMSEIERAESPADLEDFLMREMAKQLQGVQSDFTPARLIRAFETLQQHGEARGMAALEKRDAELARKMARHPRSKPVPPSTTPDINK